jgi:Domain of unknown function (DUF5666)
MIQRRLLVVLGFSALWFAGCIPRADGPVRNASSAHSEGGVGGTGLAPERPPGEGGIGVFGTITGFGSIDVNGLRVELPDALEIRTGPVPGPLRVGDTVAAAVDREGDRVVARELSRILPLIGPLEAVRDDGRRLIVMGTAILLEGGVEVRNAASGSALEPRDLAPGDWLAVSGLWRVGTVVASRIERISARATATVMGQLSVAGGRASIGATSIDLTCCAMPQPGFAVATGLYRQGRLNAERIDPGPEALFPSTV